MIYLRDFNGVDHFYQPIAVIEYKGSFNSNEDTSGHYTCDIKEKIFGSWYQTNDNVLPHLISMNDVSNLGYVALFERS